MLQRLVIACVAVGALLLAGCGTNSKLGLGDQSLTPDLTVESIEDLSDTFQLDGDAAFKVVVANRGIAGARRFKVRATGTYLISGSPICGTTRTWRADVATVEGLDAGGVASLEMGFKLPPPYNPDTGAGDTDCSTDRNFAGDWILTVEVDYTDEIAEGNESNNTLTHAFIVNDAGGSGGGGTGVPPAPTSN